MTTESGGTLDIEPAGDPESPIVRSEPPILEALLGHEAYDWETDREPGERLEEWRLWTGRRAPDPETAAAEFARTMISETDLAPEQITQMVDRLVARPERAAPRRFVSLDSWLEGCVERFKTRAQPWFPAWLGYSAWIVDWATTRGYDAVMFLCRDSLPFYVAAASTPEAEALDLALVHASRKTIVSPRIADHVTSTLGDARSIAVVDSGCYGSMVPKLMEVCELHGDRPPAVCFYASRHPMIFGYMNYVMAFDSLNAGIGPEGGGRSPADFTIYAGDVVEALPKPYLVERLREDGSPDIAPVDLLSFVLAGELLRDFARFVSKHPFTDVQHDARAAAQDRYRHFVDADAGPSAADHQLFDGCAPKNPTVEHPIDLPAEGLHPQRAFFGHEAG